MWQLAQKHRLDGTRWKDHPFKTADRVWDIWGSGPRDIWATSYKKLLHYDGATWQTVELPFQGQSLALATVWGTSKTDVWVTGDITLHFDGKRWQPQDTLATTGLSHIRGSPTGDLWAVSYSGGVLRRFR